MTLTKRQFACLAPKLDDLENPVESSSEYAGRVQKELPNFPDSVITQWFYEHPQCIEEYAWLDFSSVQFQLVTVGPQELGLPCLLDNKIIMQYRDHFLKGTESRRMSRLAAYIEKNGTWPVPPIVLDNAAGDFVSSWGFRYSMPYDLLEGHHRMAVLYALNKHVYGDHRVWLLQNSSVSSVCKL